MSPAARSSAAVTAIVIPATSTKTQIGEPACVDAGPGVVMDPDIGSAGGTWANAAVIPARVVVSTVTTTVTAVRSLGMVRAFRNGE